jgi:hypothetical protein
VKIVVRLVRVVRKRFGRLRSRSVTGVIVEPRERRHGREGEDKS